jgi:hypothetical protein
LVEVFKVAVREAPTNFTGRYDDSPDRADAPRPARSQVDYEDEDDADMQKSADAFGELMALARESRL